MKATLAGFVLAFLTTAACAATITSFDIDGAQFVFQTGIDSKGDAFGYWVDQASVRHGFVRSKAGTITKFDAPHATDTTAAGADASGNLVGGFVDGNLHKSRVYLRKLDGSFTVFDVLDGDVQVMATDPHGGITGFQPGGNSFLRKKNGKTKTFGAPNGSDTEAVAVLPDGTVAGSYSPSSGPPFLAGFIRHPDKSFTTFHVENADLTQILGMNGEGTAAGVYIMGGQAHGYIRTPDGTITPFDPAGSHLTQVEAISAKGVVAGYYKDAQDAHHGFTRAVDGTFTFFDVAGAVDTEAQTINVKGVVAGTWTDADGHEHLFVRKP
jgi:hypothetical protein